MRLSLLIILTSRYLDALSQVIDFAGAMVLSGNIDSLIDFFSFTAWIFYGGSMLALLVMRKTRPNHPRPYKCPLVIPVLVLIISAYLIVAPIIDKPQIEYLYAAGFISAGMLVYLPFVKFGYVPKFMGKYTPLYGVKISPSCRIHRCPDISQCRASLLSDYKLK